MNTERIEPALAAVTTLYRCPMHPEVRSDHAGACPRCGMALQPAGSEDAGQVVRQRRFTIGAGVLLAVSVFYLWTEHRAHLLGALPYLIFLLCPAMHLFMHHGHHDHEPTSAGEH